MPDKLSYFLQSADFMQLLVLLIAGLLALIFVVRIIRFLYNFFRYFFLSMRYKPRGSKYKQPKLKKFFPKTDESRMRDREQEKPIKTTNAVGFHIDQHDLHHELQRGRDETEIVGIAEPIGKWTKFVTSQKLSWLRAMVGSKAESERFWQNMIAAQEQAQSKQRGRSGRGM